MTSVKRGAFILFEGIDRCGKTTQSNLLSTYLAKAIQGPVEFIRFPDRTSTIGQLINSYLSSTSNMSDQTIHLLFSANRWEASQEIENKLASGCTLVCDRYAYSGVAFSSAKGLDLDWCKSCDVGLPSPDCIIYLDMPVEDAATRGSYGEERYEKIDFQKKIRDKFMILKAEDDALHKHIKWYVLDARNSIDDIHHEIQNIATTTINNVQNDDYDINKLWLKK